MPKVSKKLFRRSLKKDGETEVFKTDEETAFKDQAWQDYQSGRHKKQPLVPLALLFFFQSAVRIGELCVLKYGNITADGNYCNVSRMYRHSNHQVVDHLKGAYGDRLIPLTEKAKEILRETEKWHKECTADEYIFSLSGEPLGYTTVRNLCYEYCERIGILKKSPHKIRKTVLSALFDGGMNADAIRQIAGHMDTRTTYNSYCYDRRTDDRNLMIMNEVL